MSAEQPVQAPNEQPAQAPKKKPMGIGALLRGKPVNPVIKRPTPEMVQAIKKPPASSMEIAPQPFAPVAAATAAPVKKKKPEAGPAPQAPKKLSFAAKPTPDYHPRVHKAAIDEDELPDELLDFQDAQEIIEGQSPYLTDNMIYTPQSRKSFYRFIQDTYSNVFHLLPQVKGKLDEMACAKLEQKAGDAVEAFLYQKFIREYIRNAGPYRGMLVYHGLGSGKTCSAIAAAEALYGTSNKKIIVMTPFSLRGNFISEISFCGFRHFNVHNHWISIDWENGILASYAESVLSLPATYLRKLQQREQARRVIWIPDFTKPSNYNELSQQERDDIREQITTTIDARIKFISYNGVTAAELKRYACQADPITGERMFDNAVIVIDEIHNLTRLMQGEITQYITQRKKRTRKIPVEPIEPGRWKPGLCNTSLNYKRSYLFYKLLTDARNSKIIGLSGTPIINFPDELGILANVLAGYTECAEVTLLSSDKKVIDQFRAIAEKEPRVDMVRFRAADRQMSVLISAFQEGYESVKNKREFVGVQYKEDAQEDIRQIYPRIKAALKEAGIPIGDEMYVSYPRLPSDADDFKQEFIDPQDLSIRNKIVLQKRLTGLISYYKGSKEEYMPKVISDEIVKCEMSDYVLSMYTAVRNEEIAGEADKKKDTEDQYAAVEMFAKMKNPSSYRFRSRAICNFAFPNAIKRPFPLTKKEEVELANEVQVISEDVEVSEALANSEEDQAAAVAIAQEEAEAEAAVAEPEEAVEPAAEPAVAEPAAEEPEEPEEPAAEQEGGAGDEPIKKKKPVAGVLLEPSVQSSVEPSVEPSAQPSAQPSVKKRKPLVGILPEAPVAAAAAPAVAAVADVLRVIPYTERVARAMKQLDTDRARYMTLDDPIPEKRLGNYSTKLDHMLRRILAAKGSNLVYSQFKTVEGLGVLGVALRANGFTEIQITGSDQAPQFTPETIKSFQRGPGEKRFITFTGEGSKDRRTLILNVFNGNFDKLPPSMRAAMEPYQERRNNYGEICWVIGITGAGAEGISLKSCRAVHIMEPYWNNVRLDQVKGRAIRICSHKDLPFKERDVEIYTYLSVFSAAHLATDRIDMHIKTTDKNLTSDENVYQVSLKKDKINQSILEIMKESAVDCGLNAADNDGVQCFVVNGRPDQYLFDPDLQVDKILTSMEIKEEKPRVEDEDPLSMAAPKAKSTMIQSTVLKIKGTEYMTRAKPDMGGAILQLYDRGDIGFRVALGEVSVDPVTGKYLRVYFY